MNRIGIDIEKVSRFDLSRDDSFFANNFTKDELEYSFLKDLPKKTLCGIFCAKEAIIKTLDEQDILLNEIEIRHDFRGRPEVKAINNECFPKDKFLISISHSGEYAVAIAVRLEDEKKL